MARRLRLLAGAAAAVLLLLLLLLASPWSAGSRPSFTTGLSAGAGSVTDAASLLDNAGGPVDWTRFAYVQYVTNLAYLCNSVMLLERLQRLGCRAQRLLLYPQDWQADDGSAEARLLRLARATYGTHLQPIAVQSRHLGDPTWAESYTKLLALNQTDYDRVLSLDSDSTLLQCLDELFLLPPAPVAMPRNYWVWQKKHELSNQLMLVQPDAAEFERVVAGIEAADDKTYDMDIMNNIYMDSALVLPHRRYDLITGEFRTRSPHRDHSPYLGNKYESWDPLAILREAKFLHFSDWPVPKPWLPVTQASLTREGPQCVSEDDDSNSEPDCRDRDLWFKIYGDFKRRRMEVCGVADWGGAIEPARLPLP